MIDFPTPTTVGQIFSASNGVNYRWNGTLWLAVGQSAGGDFAASGTPALNATGLVMVLPVVNGNSGGYYNASTGRWTPPAGRYNVYGAVGAYYNGGGTGINVYIRKNGVNLVSANVNTAGANSWSLCPVETQVDANGTDYFDLWAQATATGSEGYFGAFPISGIQGPPGNAGTLATGDFMARYSGANFGMTGTAAALVFDTVLTGNSGGWYNTSNGRYTPPAGRYCINGTITAFQVGATGSWVGVAITKNGVNVQPATSNTSGSNTYEETSVSAIVDANGTDYFQVTHQASAGGLIQVQQNNCFMSAYSISGSKGPPGDPGQLGWRLLSRTVAPGAVAQLDIQNIPADINDIEVHFDLTPSNNAQDLVAQFYDAGGALDNAAAHYSGTVSMTYHTMPNGASPQSIGSATVGTSNSILLSYSLTGNRIGSVAGNGIKGFFKVPGIRNATRKALMGQAYYLRDDNTIMISVTFSGDRGISAGITGLRLLFGSGNIQAGGTMSVWGSP